MWTDFILIMTAPRIGWLSGAGLVAVALLAFAVVRYAAGDASMASVVLSGVINLTALAMDFSRNS